MWGVGVFVCVYEYEGGERERDRKRNRERGEYVCCERLCVHVYACMLSFSMS